MGYITNITNKLEVQMDLLLIIALGFSTSWLAIVLYSILIFPFVREETEYRSKSVRKRFDK